MESRKKVRRATRAQFTKIANSFQLEDAPTHEGEANYKLLQQITEKLEGLDREIENFMADSDETDIEKELDEVTNYKLRWLTIQSQYKSTAVPATNKIKNEERNFKLPRLETKKFDGNVKNWMPFWGQFEKIHNDPSMDDTDKLQYLTQAMTPGTEVCKFIESYPATKKSYQQALTDLKERYAREELLIQVYVRELLTMILHRENNNNNLAYLYDHMSAQLRALETLGVTQDGYSSFILPMVESALPLDILKAWERARPLHMKDELKSLLEFLKREVESEQRIQMATAFTQEQTETTTREFRSKESTASALVAGVQAIDKITKCLWCDKNHSSIDCFKLVKMSLEQRREHIKKKKACMNCLKIGHHAKVCKAFVQCFICKKRHSVTLCPGPEVYEKQSTKKNFTSGQTTSNFSSLGSSVTLLQTTMVKIVNGTNEITVRALVDNGSQRSYLKKDVAQKLGLRETGKETLTHCLFSGVQVRSKTHNVYNISICSYDESFKMDIVALEQAVICNNLPRYDSKDLNLSRLLDKHNIVLTDNDECTDISLLIGADYSGFIMTNTMVVLREGLVAIRTRLGWVLQGKMNNTNSNNITNTLFCSSNITDFWSLELLGIRDPVESKTKIQAEAEAMMSFEESITINAEGRYEVSLPFKVGFEELLSNHGVAERRLVATTKRLIQSGTLNWADVASRGCSAEQLLSLRWWEGPAWLRLVQAEWPKSSLHVDETEAFKELQKKKTSCNADICIKEGIEMLCYFSKYRKIIRMVAWMLRFINNIQHMEPKKTGEISVREYEKAENIVIKLIQTSQKEYITEQGKSLNTYHDENDVIRIKTKLLFSDFPESTKFPILLPAKNIIVRRLMEQRHKELQHAGANQLISDIRKRFWIIGIRRLAKSVIAACAICARYRSKPAQAPMAPLPIERIQCTAPFQVSGVDLAGPLFLRSGEKCWVVLYTCAVYRCVHLELTKSLSTDAFMLTLRRFIARKGRIRKIICDNGSNFQGAKNRLAAIDWEEVQKRATIEHIKWKMNVPTAAWWGGFFERLIRIMKDLLKRILGQSRVSYEELETILCECEAVMNQRPLTYVQDDKNDYLEPLTPASFIQCIHQTDVTDLDAADANTLNTRLRYLIKLREDFKHRFRNEYLTALVQRGKEKMTILNIGDIVLIETDEKRINWPLGIIMEIYTGKDGIKRTAKVKTSIGFKIRPFQRLYPLEVSTVEAGTQLQCNSKELEPEHFDNSILANEDTTEETRDMEVIQLDQEEEKGGIIDQTSAEKKTRSGRVVKTPSKYAL